MITENSGLRPPREQRLRFDTDIFEENPRTIVLGLAQEAHPSSKPPVSRSHS
ncbi:hypothetical protein [Streptomyces uncialis]|uniref:hypothetical protein n=1 Tax=Streptomyces uncialis TaxID=1048205 RepID=UPI00386E2529|nr:hypothetical protein OG268_02285 [Streptomyces uncialis]